MAQDLPEHEVQWSWALGLVLGLLGSLTGSLNKIFWKIGHNMDARGQPSWKWHCAGFAALVLNPPLDMLSLYFAPQTLFSATAGSGTIFQFVLAVFLLKEVPTKLDVVGSALVVIGCTGLAVSERGVKDPADTFESLMRRYRSPDFVVYVVLASAFIVTLSVVCFFSPCASKMKGSRVFAEVRKFSFGALGGSIGGLYFLLKSALILVGLGDGDIWVRPETYLVIVFAVVSTAGGVTVLNRGLKEYDALFIAPMYQVFLLVMGMISGAVFFDELKQLTLTERVLFWISGVIMLFGIVCCMLSDRPARELGGGAGLAHADALGEAVEEGLQKLSPSKPNDGHSISYGTSGVQSPVSKIGLNSKGEKMTREDAAL